MEHIFNAISMKLRHTLQQLDGKHKKMTRYVTLNLIKKVTGIDINILIGLDATE